MTERKGGDGLIFECYVSFLKYVRECLPDEHKHLADDLEDHYRHYTKLVLRTGRRGRFDL